MPANDNPFPRSGNNFTTILCLDDIKDPDALLEALELDMVFFEFELPPTTQKRTDTVEIVVTVTESNEQTG